VCQGSSTKEPARQATELDWDVDEINEYVRGKMPACCCCHIESCSGAMRGNVILGGEVARNRF